MNRTLWYLKGCNLFSGLTPAQAERLDRNAMVRSYRRHAIIYAPAEASQSIFALAKGRVKIKDITTEGKETILAFIEEGEIFGELALVDAEPRQEYAEALVDSEVLLLPRSDLLWLMEHQPDVALSVTRLIGLRRRRLENRLRNVLFFSSRQRLVRMLLELVQSHGQVQGNRGDIRLPLTHYELASLIGVTRETVTATLGKLQAEGLIHVHKRRITVWDLKGLMEESNRAAQFAGA